MTYQRLTYDAGRDLVIDTCDRLRLARIKAGIEQEEMAEILGVSSSTVSNWENGRTAPKTAFVSAWAQITGFNMASLVSEADADRLLAGTRKRHTPPDPENPGQGVCLLPRMDSNHQPSDLCRTLKTASISTYNVDAYFARQIVCHERTARPHTARTFNRKRVSWNIENHWNIIKAAGQTAERGFDAARCS